MTSKGLVTKQKIDKINIIKSKDLSSSKDIIKELKTAHQMGKYLQIMYLIGMQYPEYIKKTLITPKQKQLNKKWAKDTKRYLSKETKEAQ